MTPRPLETHIGWTSKDVADPDVWTVTLTPQDHRELDHALARAKLKSDNLLDIGREHFPLDGLAHKLDGIARELIDGRGFTRISALDASRYDDDDLTMLYWGIGLYLGDPWPQNAKGHVMGDVTDQGKRLDDPTFRGNELGQVALDYHTDGADVIGLMCLRKAARGGLSCVANAVAIYNEMVAKRPDLAALLFEPQPYDLRGEQAPGGKPFYLFPVFTEHRGRFFIRFIPAYIRASQRHAEAPRLTPQVLEALDMVSAMAREPRFNVVMDLEPGEMQFINNYHVLHGRTSYTDDAASGRKRHLKRLWLATHALEDRPPHFRKNVDHHWAKNRSVSRIAAVPVN
ncbi:MAG: TauD/TfdA family dioxygenase [Alphaproteobacteria bacterium]|nr:TauD/TfdA family dioxygenase [Alphaproteobacteria bacterium]